MRAGALAGCKVLVTRPAGQSGALSKAIESAGGTAVSFPVIDIQPRPDDEIRRDLAGTPAPDIVIFVSRNAVEFGAPYIAGHKGDIAAIGRATANQLAEAGLCVSIDPGQGFTSEQMLEHEDLQAVAGKSVLIVRGANGRPLLGNVLSERSADVHYLDTYEPNVAGVTEADITELDRSWQSGGIDVVSVMSVATFEALVGVLPSSTLVRLRQTPLVAPGERVIQTIGKLVPGIPAIQASGPHPEDIVNALSEWRRTGTSS